MNFYCFIKHVLHATQQRQLQEQSYQAQTDIIAAPVAAQTDPAAAIIK